VDDMTRPDLLPAWSALAYVAGGVVAALVADRIGTAADGLGTRPTEAPPLAA
jgi:hypothetical protein